MLLRVGSQLQWTFSVRTLEKKWIQVMVVGTLEATTAPPAHFTDIEYIIVDIAVPEKQ